jgi:hypothetical protein
VLLSCPKWCLYHEGLTTALQTLNLGGYSVSGWRPKVHSLCPPPIQDMGTEDGHTEDQMWHLEFKSIWFLYLQEVTIPWVIAAQDCPLAIGEPSSWRDTLWLEGADVSLSLCLGGS